MHKHDKHSLNTSEPTHAPSYVPSSEIVVLLKFSATLVFNGLIKLLKNNNGVFKTMNISAKLKWASIFVISIFMLSACGGENSTKSLTEQDQAIEKIATFAKFGATKPKLKDYQEAGLTGVNEDNLEALNNIVKGLVYTDVDTKEELQAILDTLNITLPDTTKPVITLNGKASITLKKGDSYTEAGANATDDRDGNITVIITGSVNTEKEGSYTISYTAEDKAKNKASATRTVIVESTSCVQVITHAYNPKTNEEKDFPTPCDVPEGWVVGTPPPPTTTIPKDTIAPVLTLLGKASITLTEGDVYVDAGATANDNKDGDITFRIATVNPVNTAIPKTYAVTYNVKDNAGNAAQQITRTVKINPLVIIKRTYGIAGSSKIAAAVQESEFGNSTIITPVGITAKNPVPVVLFAPGFKNIDYTKYQTLLNFIASHGYAVIFANDTNGFSADDLLKHIRQMTSNPAIKPLLDTSRIGVIGHSSGGGHAFRILKELSDANNEGWGENGRFLMALEPWFAFDLTEKELKTLPSNTNIIIQQYGKGGNNIENSTDARIPLTEYYLLDSIADKQKDYQIFVDADHGYPYGSGAYSAMQGILKPLDGLMELTFQKTPDAGAQQTALEVGNDDPYKNGHGIQEVKLIRDYKYPCHGATTIIDYCAIFSGAIPPESTFDSIATNTVKAKPALGESFVDQEFGKTITRFTDRINQADTPLVDKDGNRVSRGNSQPYPKTQAWNSDMTMIRMRYRLYDAKTLKELAITSGTDSLHDLYSINGALNEMKWSSVDPNVFYGVYNGTGNNNGSFWKGTINTAKTSIKWDLVKSFASTKFTYDRFTLGKYEGNIDYNDKYVVFAARKKGQKYLTALVYDIQNNTVRKSLEFPNVAWPDNGQVFDWMSVSPLGKHILMSTGGKIDQYDMDLNFVRALASSGGHGDLGVDQDGNEAYVQYEYGKDNGIWIYRLNDGLRTRLLPDKYNGGHISCRNYKRQGWCYASTTEPGYKEIIAIKLDYSGPNNHIVNRFAQTHTSATAQSMGNISPDGKQILFESDWGDSKLHWADKDTYLVR